jgi:hypothetical protein
MIADQGFFVKRLQHQHPKHNNDINRLAAGVALLSLAGVNVAASISARKLSNGTTQSIISSGSPFAEITASRLSASKKRIDPSYPHPRILL